MTIRDIDVPGFDVQQMIATYQQWGVTLFSFFAGGYVTTYPTRLEWQRVAPGLKGRDLCGEILTAAREAGIVCWPMIDLGEIPEEVANRHPDWPGRKSDGSFIYKSNGIVSSCPLGDYVRKCSRELVLEMVERYGQIDGIKWGGASYQFGQGVCHCAICRQRYPAETGNRLPEDPADPIYAGWRHDKISETVRHLARVVHEAARIPVVGNSVWHLGRGMSLAGMADDQDFTQVEIQLRTFDTSDDGDGGWGDFFNPIETTRYVASLTRRRPWVVASYFLAWPWRWVAVPWQEQKIYLAQVAANGGSPMVNLTTGAPAQHYDPRGFRAIDELYGFMKRNAALFEGDRSLATVAIVYDHDSSRKAADAGRLRKDYLHDLQTCQQVLDRWHLPYDIVDSGRLEEMESDRCAALLIPSPIGMEPAAIQQLERLAKCGAGLVVTGFPPEQRAPFETLFGGRVSGDAVPTFLGPHPNPVMAYAKVQQPDHPICRGIEPELVPIVTPSIPVQPAPGSDVVLTRGIAFRLFPEGLAFPDAPDLDNPLCLAREVENRRTVWFPIAAGRVAKRTGHPDNERLIVNAVEWAARGRLPLRCEGVPDLMLSIRRVGESTVIHAINTTGRHRYLRDYAPLHEVRIRVPKGNRSAIWHQGEESFAVEIIDTGADTDEIVIPRIVDYGLLELKV